MLPPSSSLPRQFSLSDIISATNNFSSDLIIGSGSFGTVYKATINPIATTVAVKRHSFDSKQGSIEFWTEVNLLSDFRHTHLVSLIGYYFEHDEMILVYEYMDNGTLADHIYKSCGTSSCLSWEQRVKICIGVARGVEYLHSGTGIEKTVIHRDLKSSNILLDANWVAKISDFGLSKSCSTIFETKVDVYAFGVVLLEVLCGRRSLDFEVVDREKKLGLWVQECVREGVVHRIVDPGLRGTIVDDGLRIFLDIIVKCLQDCPDKRPSMLEVVAKLEAVLDR